MAECKYVLSSVAPSVRLAGQGSGRTARLDTPEAIFKHKVPAELNTVGRICRGRVGLEYEVSNRLPQMFSSY